MDAMKLPEDWINQTSEWRIEKMENAPKPFTTPNLFDSAFYLFTEVVELAGAIHKLYTSDHLRNPESLRGSISDELGDCFLMLATVCKHADIDGFQLTRTYEASYASGAPFWYQQLDRLIEGSYLLISTVDEQHTRHNLCARIYRYLLATAKRYELDPWDALRGSMAKMEERAGL